MLGYRLFRHAVLMLIDNISHALKISLLPFVSLVVLTYVLLLVLAELAIETNGLEQSPMAWVGIIALLSSYLIVLVWVAVGWHRYILEGVEPSLAWPDWKSDRMWAYSGAFLRIIPLSLLLCFAALLVFLIPAAVFNGGDVSTNDGSFLGFLLGVVVSYIWMRLSLVLPAAALGLYMRVPDSWSATKEYSKPIFAAALCVGILAAIPNLLLLTPLGPIIDGLVYFLVAQWFLLMLGITMMTALYGHIIENRALR